MNDARGGEARIRAARFPARKMLEEFDFSFQRSIQTLVLHLARLDCLHERSNTSSWVRPAIGKRILRLPSRSAPASPGTASSSPPPPEGSPASATFNAKAGSEEPCRLERIPLLVVDEVGLHIPFDPGAATVMFTLVSNRYERAPT